MTAPEPAPVTIVLSSHNVTPSSLFVPRVNVKSSALGGTDDTVVRVVPCANINEVLDVVIVN